MARYTVTARAYINERLVEAGEAVDVADDTMPGAHMEPARDEKGREDKAARAAKDKAGEQKPMPAPGDPRYIGDLIAHNVNDGGTAGRVEASSSHAAVPGVIVDEKGQVRGIEAVNERDTPKE